MTEEPIRKAVVTFIECEIRGPWKRLPARTEVEEIWNVYRCFQEKDAIISLVRPDDMTREFSFRNGAIVFIGANAVKFEQNDVIDEHSVDQDKRDGKKGKSTVV